MKRSLAIVVAAVLAVSTPVLVRIADAQETSNRKIIRVNGAGMSSDQVQKWAQRFMEANTEIGITVVDSSSRKGFQSLLEGNAEVAMMSREIRSEERRRAAEKGLKLVERPVGHAALALITIPRNPVNELTMEQVQKFYTGEYRSWKNVGGIDESVRCLARRIRDSGGTVFFWTNVLDSGHFGRNTTFTESWEEIIKICQVAEDLPLGIAPSARNLNGVKVLAIRQDKKSPPIKPTEETVKNGSYPITLLFAFAWDERLNDPGILRFVEFCQGHGLDASARHKE